MTDKPYIPQKDSLPEQVCGFFKNNPNEELTLEDICAKFIAVRGNIHTQLKLAVDAFLLTRIRNQDGDYIYQAGPKLGARAAGMPRLDTQPATPAKAQPKPRQPRRAALPDVVLPTIDQVVIEEGIPLPSRGGGSRDWTPLLKKLTPLQSACLPIQAKATLAKSITTAHAAKQGRYATKLLPDTQQVRVWRVA